jgi:hypothetical protein
MGSARIKASLQPASAGCRASPTPPEDLRGLLVVERVTPCLQHAQSRLLDPRAITDVEGRSDLVRVHASLRPDERTDQGMPKQNPVDRGVLVPGMGGTRPSARFFPGDLELEDREDVASQDRPVDAAPRDLYRAVVARLEPEFLVEPPDGQTIDALRRPGRSGSGCFMVSKTPTIHHPTALSTAADLSRHSSSSFLDDKTTRFTASDEGTALSR